VLEEYQLGVEEVTAWWALKWIPWLPFPLVCDHNVVVLFFSSTFFCARGVDWDLITAVAVIVVFVVGGKITVHDG
jgi:hypothetical protein